jgi:cytochrome c oxidase cbb3-type subunit III
MFRILLYIPLLILIGILPDSASAAPDGQKLYTKHCSVCHNDDGMGGIGLPLNGEKIEHFPRDYLFKTIRNGRPGRVMPAFSKLSDAQVNAIVDHVLDWKKTSLSEQYSDQPVQGNAQRGKLLFEEKCAACHGKNGKSEGTGTGVTLSREREFAVVPPALNNAGFLASASDEWIKSTITNGRPGTIMPSQQFFKFSEQQLNDVVSYVRSFQTETIEEAAIDAEDPTIVVDSPYDFVTTVSNIKQSLQGLNFRYFPDRYLEMGLADDAVINKKQLSLRFCNFKQLYKMINIEPRLGVVLPCRVTVVEQPDGSVKIYAMNMKVVARLFNNTQLIEVAGQMHQAILELLDEATL